MIITFLGTAAAEGVPAIFCNCAACLQAKDKGGKNIRTRSQIMVNNDLLIDFPPDTYSHMLTNKLDLSSVKNIFITHSHTDHCYPQEFILHGAPYAHNMTQPVLNIYASATVIRRCKRQMRYELKQDIASSLYFKKIKPYETVLLENTEVTALPARHTKSENCFIYLIKSGNCTYMQFNDSGVLDESVYSFLAQSNVKLDIISYDCTYGDARKGKGRHMGMLDNADERTRMEKHGIANENTIHVLTHFSHNSIMSHNEIAEKAKTLGFIAAYDGMTIEI